jgi:hypothetical protein
MIGSPAQVRPARVDDSGQQVPAVITIGQAQQQADEATALIPTLSDKQDALVEALNTAKTQAGLAKATQDNDAARQALSAVIDDANDAVQKATWSSPALKTLKDALSGNQAVFETGINPDWGYSQIEAQTTELNAVAEALAPLTKKLRETPDPPPPPKPTTPAKPAPGGAGVSTVRTYSVEVRGNVTADLGEFKAVAAATYADPSGWASAGVSFQEVASGGNFVLILSEASLMKSYSSVCSAKWSCTVGNRVIINQDRWLGATDSWNGAGASLASYRTMVINHETGHYLGHRDNERVCQSAGAPAPLMQQQSMSLRGCAPNPWPLPEERSYR